MILSRLAQMMVCPCVVNQGVWLGAIAIPFIHVYDDNKRDHWHWCTFRGKDLSSLFFATEWWCHTLLAASSPNKRPWPRLIASPT